MKIRRSGPAWLLAGLLSSPLLGDWRPIGPEFQVNVYTTSWQSWPGLTVFPDGSFVAVWESNGSFGTDQDVSSVQARVHRGDGLPAGNEFQVNTYTTGGQGLPTVAGWGSNRFVVAWTSVGSPGTDGSGTSILARRLPDVVGYGPDFQVNEQTQGDQAFPSVAAAADGRCVVTWVSDPGPQDDSGQGVRALAFGADGLPAGAEFQVNSLTEGPQTAPHIAMGPDGGFLIVWMTPEPASPETGSEIHGQRYWPDGMPRGGEFRVNSYTTNDQAWPRAAVQADGSFVVVWSSYGSPGPDDSYWSAQGRRFGAAGEPLGTDFQVNAYTSWSQEPSSVSATADGGYVVSWTSSGSTGSDHSGTSVQVGRLGAAGAILGPERQVNTYANSYQSGASVIEAEAGSFVALWTSAGSGGTDHEANSIQGQLLAWPQFEDGFESGDTSAWSGTVPATPASDRDGRRCAVAPRAQRTRRLRLRM